MKKQRALVIGGSLFAAVIIALLVIPGFVDWSKYQSIARQKVKEATGYDLAINGAFRIGFLPTPHATIGDVVVTKPVAGHSDPFLALEQADVHIALIPLLSGKVEVSSVTLEKPVVTLVTYKDGTNNYTPVSQASAQESADASASSSTSSASGGQNVSVNAVRIEDGQVTVRDDATGTMHTVGIKDLRVKADTLSGPFDVSGAIGYDDAAFDVNVSTGGYRAGETLPVQLTASDKDGRADVKWSGVVDTGKKEAQGELGLSFGDLAGLLHDVGVSAAVPSLGGRTTLSGMLTAGENRVVLTNGALDLAGTKFAAKLDVEGLKSETPTVSANLETNDLLDIGAWMDVAGKVKAQQDKAAGKAQDEKAKDAKPAAKTASPAQSAATLLPADFALPTGLKGDVQIRARGLSYHDKATGAFDAHATASDGKGDVHVTLADLPGGGNFALSAATAGKGVVTGTALGTIASLPDVLSGWLALVDAKTFDQPGMPKRVDMDADIRIEGRTAQVTFSNLALGEPKLTGGIAYTVGARPLLNVRLAGNVWTLPAPAAAASAQTADAKDAKADTAASSSSGTPAKIDIDFNPPQLPFGLKFDLALDRLVRGDLTLTNVRAVGAYDGKGLNLTTAEAGMNGGTLSASGAIADLKAMSGVDMQAGLRTGDLQGFVGAVTGKPLDVKTKIGAFDGTIKAKGDRKSMAVNAMAQALGFTLNASGTLDDPFSPELPGTLNIRLRNPDMVQAIRVFSPGFGNSGAGGAKPVDIAATLGISGKVYTLSDLKATLGSSDLSGKLKADLGGGVPSITADLASKTLDVGALVGVSGKDSARKAAASNTGQGASTTTAANSGTGQWSREALDTGFMKAVNADIKLSAGTLIYGNWTLTDAKAALALKDGVMKVSPLSGKLFGGTLDGTLDASSSGSGQPLNVALDTDVKNVAIGSFLQALTSSTQKRADGTGSASIAIKGAGVSAAALVSSLNGGVDVAASNLVIYGMDIDKLAANIVEAFDGGWKGVLAGFATQGFSGGQTKFKDFSDKFPITNGDMAVNGFKLETTNTNAILTTNGTVSFARWTMDLQSNVQVTQPNDVPVIGLRLSGPLDSPSKSVSSDALDSLVRKKLGNKVQNLIDDKLGGKLKDSPVGGIVNQFLGGGQSSNTQPSNTPPSDSASPDTAPVQQPQQQQKTPQQQLLEGVLNSLGR
ncbi:MAG: AsmA family protein [Rhodospirillales bacterium]|nr:AsmA family protein [Alphaproteobacteria bacterium]MCB9986120.1 AsmA family protein [Rhodospirillales bacterium]USO07320.1 MAG: AsmA family protein [Rhodospirillales bacterium]